ncbi:MAG: 4-hydroxy-tetrahydrodipicolinate reductase [Actinobacteria bacterium]|nr:4-hydroxy-tetrahydrodipicolinate reductase [Actinomycetota bacterium]
MTTKVGVIGASGKMGSEVCRAVEADDDLELVARVVRGDSLGALVDSGAEVAIEFSIPDSVKDNAAFCLRNGIHTVIGTTGLTSGDLDELGGLAKKHEANCFVAPNFAIGAVLMMEFAARASPYFEVAEIVERHDKEKLDAPSGTSLRTAALMNEARTKPWDTPVGGKESLPGARGGEVDGVHVHSLRTPGSVAHQEVILGSPGQTLTIRHDSQDRGSFMPGVILAVKRVSSLEDLTVGLERLLDL